MGQSIKDKLCVAARGLWDQTGQCVNTISHSPEDWANIPISLSPHLSTSTGMS